MDDREVMRCIQAMTLGAMADREFENQCRRRGLSPHAPTCVIAPSDYLAIPRQVAEARRDQ